MQRLSNKADRAQFLEGYNQRKKMEANLQASLHINGLNNSRVALEGPKLRNTNIKRHKSKGKVDTKLCVYGNSKSNNAPFSNGVKI
jgi:hypothetical protein